MRMSYDAHPAGVCTDCAVMGLGSLINISIILSVCRYKFNKERSKYLKFLTWKETSN